ncbi:hypothetical protein HLB44_32045 [Aquincola sp. S2]|uniref:Sigma-54 factor interaction domain-containing protein n=1 Tax=Pseudaquabacterium terrae TaxID=2732868 RepID=A0ABX2ESF3_9BURK|nr:hypothetical protein [Aquabacterium terrae]NRF71630.1 hypothetical protein [Aquabacterium terrae]
MKVISLKIPTLRERQGDILPLAESLLDKHAAESGRSAPRLLLDVRHSSAAPINPTPAPMPAVAPVTMATGRCVCSIDISISLSIEVWLGADSRRRANCDWRAAYQARYEERHIRG